MITRSKPSVTVSRHGNQNHHHNNHSGKSHHGGSSSGTATNVNRQQYYKGTAAPLIWPAKFNPPTLLLAQRSHQPLPPGVRKIVNPVTVNALMSALNMRTKPPPPPSSSSVAPGCSWSPGPPGGLNCCTCCYCCCDLPRKSTNVRKINNRSSSNIECNNNIPIRNNGHVQYHWTDVGDRESAAKMTRHLSRSRDKLLDDYCSDNEKAGSGKKQKFVKVTSVEDTQAIRCAEFHPRGHLYAVGSNSKTLRICGYPSLSLVSENQVPHSPNILYKRNKHHRGSIYCLGWSPDGSLLATGSNDKTIKLLRFDDINRQQQYSHSQEVELTMHDGTVRDICFIEDLSNKSSLIVSGGAGDCKVYVTDCVTATPFQSLSGHSAPILSLYNWGGVMFCSGSQDKTVRIWDLRSRGCVNVISPLTCPSSGTTKSPVGSVCVDPTGRLLISGHEDSAIVLYDIRGNRQIQSINVHAADVRSVRFSPNAYYLLSAGYDQTLMLTDLQGDLSVNLNSVPVASHDDKIISARWHPSEFTFLSTSADKNATLWALPSP